MDLVFEVIKRASPLVFVGIIATLLLLVAFSYIMRSPVILRLRRQIDELDSLLADPKITIVVAAGFVYALTKRFAEYVTNPTAHESRTKPEDQTHGKGKVSE